MAILCTAIIALATLDTATISHDQDVSADFISSRVIEWEMSLATFSGSYVIEQQRTIDSKHGDASVVSKETSLTFRYHITCRWDRQNIYFEMSKLFGSDESPDIETYALYAGVMNSLTVDSFGSRSVQNIRDQASLPFPWGAYLLPEEIFGGYSGGRLIDVFSSGTSYLVSKDDVYILSHLNDSMGKYVDITLDNDYNIQLIEWIERPPLEIREKLMSAGVEHVMSLRKLRRTLCFEAVDLIDGVIFPTIVRKTWWMPDKELGREIARKADTGEIDELSFYEMMYSRPVTVFTQQTFLLENARLNAPLHEEDFDIRYPSNTVHYEHDKQPGPGGTPVPEPSFFGRLFPYIVGTLLVFCIVILLWVYLKR